MKKIILDTNAYSAMMNGKTKVKEAIENAGTVQVPVIVIAELLFGFKNGSKEIYNLNLLESFLQLTGISVLHTAMETAQFYAEIVLNLKSKGKPIPTNDIWIAALAIQADGELVTYDNHFLNITNLKVWDEIK